MIIEIECCNGLTVIQQQNYNLLNRYIRSVINDGLLYFRQKKSLPRGWASLENRFQKYQEETTAIESG